MPASAIRIARAAAKVNKQSPDQIADRIKEFTKQGQVVIIVPLIRDQKGEHRRVLDEIRKSNYAQVRIDGMMYHLEEMEEMSLDRTKSIRSKS